MNLLISRGGLFRPYIHLRGVNTFAGVLTPILSLLGAAAVSSIPLYQAGGIWVVALYAVVSFFALCFLRRWIFGMAVYPAYYGSLISSRTYGFVEAGAVIIPSILWIGASFLGAYLLGGKF